ncbi:MAG: hypothetical protein IPJ65_42120 [Archangiaceae bacterium]|nr:hypothetical protein [Archangiaceae bacterium]
MSSIRLSLLVTFLGCSACTAPSTRCGDGTVLTDGECRADAVAPSCAAGTVRSGDACVPDLPQLCGEGTRVGDTQCTATPAGTTCGAGTRLDGTACIVADPLTCGANTVRQGSACIGTSSPLTCGSGTQQQGAQCVAVGGVQCATGTTLSNNQCVPLLSSICGTGTSPANNGTQCVSTLACGTGTTRVGNVCQPNLSTVCGTGTLGSAGTCQVDGASVCDTGLVFTAGKCRVAAGSAGLQAFTSAASTHKVSYFRDKVTDVTDMRIAITNLSQGSADGWTGANAALVGQGESLLISARGAWYGPAFQLQIGQPLSVSLQNTTTSGGQCSDSNPNISPVTVSTSWLARANFWSWSAASATNSVCVLGGSMVLERTAGAPGGPDRVKITLNVQFKDGTTWQDLVFWADHRTD